MKRTHPTKYKWGSRRGKPWSSADYNCARFLRHCGMTNADIGEILNRSENSVEHKIGYQRSRDYAVIYEAARPKAAFDLGRMVDSFLAMNTAGNA